MAWPSLAHACERQRKNEIWNEKGKKDEISSSVT